MTRTPTATEYPVKMNVENETLIKYEVPFGEIKIQLGLQIEIPVVENPGVDICAVVEVRPVV